MRLLSQRRIYAHLCVHFQLCILLTTHSLNRMRLLLQRHMPLMTI
jgi:hypothetical protein